MKWYKFGLRDDVGEALEREAKKKSIPPEALVETILLDWLVAKGNLRIY